MSVVSWISNGLAGVFSAAVLICEWWAIISIPIAILGAFRRRCAWYTPLKYVGGSVVYAVLFHTSLWINNRLSVPDKLSATLFWVGVLATFAGGAKLFIRYIRDTWQRTNAAAAVATDRIIACRACGQKNRVPNRPGVARCGKCKSLLGQASTVVKLPKRVLIALAVIVVVIGYTALHIRSDYHWQDRVVDQLSYDAFEVVYTQPDAIDLFSPWQWFKQPVGKMILLGASAPLPNGDIVTEAVEVERDQRGGVHQERTFYWFRPASNEFHASDADPQKETVAAGDSPAEFRPIRSGTEAEFVLREARKRINRDLPEKAAPEFQHQP
jgi:hypothetical protein